jgi:hypothetical protein
VNGYDTGVGVDLGRVDRALDRSVASEETGKSDEHRPETTAVAGRWR